MPKESMQLPQSIIKNKSKKVQFYFNKIQSGG
jgi:hypothetical protein